MLLEKSVNVGPLKTFTSQVSVTPAAVAVIVTVPVLIAVKVPLLLSTFTILSSLLVHVTSGLETSLSLPSLTIAVKVS